MTNEEKAQHIIGCNRANCLACGGSLSVQNGCAEFERIIAMADFKDTQPIFELGGWHTEPPTEDGCYLAETKYIAYKNSCFLVAEYDTNAQCWYDEAFENPIEIIRWKKI